MEIVAMAICMSFQFRGAGLFAIIYIPALQIIVNHRRLHVPVHHLHAHHRHYCYCYYRHYHRLHYWELVD